MMAFSPPSLVLSREFEPDVLDGFSLAPFVFSQTFATYVEQPLSRTLWHGFWVVPLSMALNAAVVPLLTLAVAINLLASTIAHSVGKKVFAHHHLNTAHDAFFYAKISFIRIFFAAYNPLKVV